MKRLGVQYQCCQSIVGPPQPASLFYNLPDFDIISLTDANIKNYISIMQPKYVLHWQHTLQHSKKLEFYNIFLKIIKERIQAFIDAFICILFRPYKLNERKALVKFRIGNHKLIIEIGRYDQTPRVNRLCPICVSNQVKDEIPFLLS